MSIATSYLTGNQHFIDSGILHTYCTHTAHILHTYCTHTAHIPVKLTTDQSLGDTNLIKKCVAETLKS